MTSVVLCDAYYMPVKEISVEHAVYLLVSGKAEPIYTADGLETVAELGLAPSAIANWSAKFQNLIVDGKFLVPSIIRLLKAVGFRLSQIKPSRTSVFKRDKHTCQYCGSKSNITLDHVMPQSRGGENTWENLVAACGPCNNTKGNRTPDEAGMKLAKEPKRWMPTFRFDVMEKIMGSAG